MIAVATFTSLDRIEPLRNRWRELWSQTPDATFSRTYEAFSAAVRAGVGEPRLFVATVGGRTVGYWPMLLTRDRGPFRGDRVLKPIGTSGGRSGTLGGHPTATGAIVARHLRSHPADWDRIEVPETRGGTAAALAAAGLAPVSVPSDPEAEVELGGRWSDVVARCDEATRLAIYRSNYAAGTGRSPVFGRTRPKSAEAFEPLAAEVAAVLGRGTTWGDAAGWRELAAAAANAGAADVAVLRSFGRPLAAAVGFVTGSAVDVTLFAVAADAPAGTDVRFLNDLLRDGLQRGDRTVRFPAAAAGHPVLGFATAVRQTARCRAISPGRASARLARWAGRLPAMLRGGTGPARPTFEPAAT